MKKLFFVSVLFIFSCAEKSVEFTKENKKQVESEVTHMLDSYFADIGNNGLMEEFKYLDSTDQFYWTPPGYQQAADYNTIRTAITTNSNKFKSVRNQWTRLIITPLSKELAVYNGNIHSVTIDTSGTETQIDLIETGIVVKRVSQWKLLNGQTSIIDKPTLVTK